MNKLSNFDLKRVSQMLPARIDPRLLTRRNAILVGAGAVALAAASAWMLYAPSGTTTAVSRKGARPTEVSVDELMKPGPLAELQVGNADAPVTIVEYASMTCGHCASFHNTVYPALKAKYIDTGKARLIMREFPLDDRATGAAMLARCTGDGKTFPLISALFAKQEEWAFVSKESFVPELAKIARQAGFTEDSLRTCLRDQALMDKILEGRRRGAEEFGVNSANVDAMKGSGSAEVRRFLGIDLDFGKRLGLSADWTQRIVKQIGNYGEMFDRHLGLRSPLKLERRQNNLAANGGLHYAPSFR